MLAGMVNYDSFTVQGTVITIVNYESNTFIVQAIGWMSLLGTNTLAYVTFRQRRRKLKFYKIVTWANPGAILVLRPTI